MEEMPKRSENVEMLSEWRELREQAPEQAKLLISEIDGFMDMAPTEQIDALSLLIDHLAQDNRNRYIARVIGIKREKIKVENVYKQQVEKLGMVA